MLPYEEQKLVTSTEPLTPAEAYSSTGKIVIPELQGPLPDREISLVGRAADMGAVRLKPDFLDLLLSEAEQNDIPANAHVADFVANALADQYPEYFPHRIVNQRELTIFE